VTTKELKRFEDALDRWGSDLDAWPPESARWGRALLRTSAAARHIHEGTSRLDDALATLPLLRASTALKQRIADSVAEDNAWQTVRSFVGGSLWRPALAAGIPLLVGFWLGMIQGHDDASAAAEQVSLLVFSTDLEELTNEP